MFQNQQLTRFCGSARRKAFRVYARNKQFYRCRRFANRFVEDSERTAEIYIAREKVWRVSSARLRASTENPLFRFNLPKIRNPKNPDFMKVNRLVGLRRLLG